MQEFEIIVDFNGIVLVDPSLLDEFYGGIMPGDNLYQRFIKTEDGDEVVNRGIVVPILGVNDGTYRIVLREQGEKSSIPENHVVVSNGVFPFKVGKRAVMMDMANLLEWYPDENQVDVSIPPGCYEIRINGFREVADGIVQDVGFEFVFNKCEVLPRLTGSLAKNMQVLELPVQRA